MTVIGIGIGIGMGIVLHSNITIVNLPVVDHIVTITEMTLWREEAIIGGRETEETETSERTETETAETDTPEENETEAGEEGNLAVIAEVTEITETEDGIGKIRIIGEAAGGAEAEQAIRLDWEIRPLDRGLVPGLVPEEEEEVVEEIDGVPIVALAMVMVAEIEAAAMVTTTTPNRTRIPMPLLVTIDP